MTIWGIVIMLHLLMTMSGQSTSFHEPMSVMMPTVINTAESGQNIWNRIDSRSIHVLTHRSGLEEAPEELPEYDDSMLLTIAGMIRAR